MGTEEKDTTGGSWNELLDMLGKQADLYEKFLGFLSEKEKALIKGDVKELNEIARIEAARVAELEALEDQRRAAAAALKGSDVTLRELLETAPEQIAGELEKSAMRLMDILNKVAIKNRSNTELVGAAMDFVRYMLNLLSSSTGPDEGTYESTGRMRQQEIRIKSILNKQV